MATDSYDWLPKLERRVVLAAEAALATSQGVSLIDVFVGIRWLAPPHVDMWRQGRLEYLEQMIQVNPHNLTAAIAIFRRWAEAQGLRPSETEYVARTPSRPGLRFSGSGDPTIERAYRTHWLSPSISEAERRRIEEKASRPPDLVVISPVNDWTCAVCSGTGDLLIMDASGPSCLTCAGLDHLEFLPAGDAALTRRAKKASGLSAVVVRFSRTRKRYERIGLLVANDALVRASASNDRR